MTTPNDAILLIKANINGDIEDLVTQWCNATEVEVTETGDIWIANPMTGNWLDDERKAAFVAWCNKQ